MRSSVEGTAIFLDIRNFTSNLNNLFTDDSYLSLIEKVYEKGIELGIEFCSEKEFYINTTGDGFLAIFLGKDNCINAYFYSLLLHHCLSKLFVEYFKSELMTGQYYFGIGLEFGEMKNVRTKQIDKEINTYLGNVINIAARLEALSKDHTRSPIIFGPCLNECLVREIFGECYTELMDQAKKSDSTENAQALHQKMTMINSKLLSSYIFEHKLKGVDSPVPVFRVSPTLFNMDTSHFKDLVGLLPDNKINKIHEVLDKHLCKKDTYKECL
jgi:class 3 adenylate cyclase